MSYTVYIHISPSGNGKGGECNGGYEFCSCF